MPKIIIEATAFSDYGKTKPSEVQIKGGRKMSVADFAKEYGTSNGSLKPGVEIVLVFGYSGKKKVIGFVMPSYGNKNGELKF